jgi:beta-glucosidase
VKRTRISLAVLTLAGLTAALLPAVAAGAQPTGSGPAAGGDPHAAVPVSPLATPRERAAAIVAKMTLDEKIGQLHGIRDDARGLYRHVPAIPRLGVPAFMITNGPAGVSTGAPYDRNKQPSATALPAPLALAASFDTAQAQRYGDLAGKETRLIGRDLLEGPTVNMVRVPMNGRTFESYGEDPYLAGRIATGWLTGVQAHKVMGNVKHYIANNQETNRFNLDELIDERTLREIYLPAFEAAVTEGRSASVMCAYPRVNGTFSCENRLLLTDILKRDWGFDGFVFSDFGAVHSTVPSARAGLDLEMPTGKYFGTALRTAVQNGQVSAASLDEKLVRRFTKMIEYGIFDTPRRPGPIPAQEHGAVARQLAQQGMVLLKNTPVGSGPAAAPVLPIAASVRSIALVGRNAAKTGGGGSSRVKPLYTVTPLAGLRARAGAGVTVTHNDGTNTAAAAAAARAADVAVVMVEDNQREGADKPGLALEGNQDALVRAVAAANPRTVVVSKTGGPVLMPWLAQVPAVLQAWYPGEEDGNAVAGVLFGSFNPSAKLPVTFPRSQADLPTRTPAQYPGTGRTVRYSEGVFMGYRHYDRNGIAPMFPFGHGLSYTTFSYANLEAAAGADGQVTVQVDVTNTGTRLGGEIVQVYVGSPSSAAVPEAPRELQGFAKATLRPGETRHLSFTLGPRAFSHWDAAADRWKVAGGSYAIEVGSGSRDIRLRTAVQLPARP